jgi:hypothetical protein
MQVDKKKMGGKIRFGVLQWFVGSIARQRRLKDADPGYPVQSGYDAKTYPMIHGRVDGRAQR